MSFCERRYNKALFWGSPFYVCTPSPFPLLRYIEILERGKQISRVISKGGAVARTSNKLYKRFVTAVDPISSLNEGFRLRN